MKLNGFGQDDGRDEGLERRREELRNTLAEVFEVRGIPVGSYERMRIYREDSIERLRAWHRRALTASSATEVVGAAPQHDAVAELVQYEKIMNLGLRQGLDRGREALRGAVLDAFQTRGIEVSPLGRKRIEAETSFEQLREWLRRALTAASAADVLCNAWIPDRPRREPVIFDDFVRFGQDQGIEEGREEGREALRRSLLDLIEARGIPIGDDERARIAAETSFEWLRAWIRRALTAMSAAEVVDDAAG